MIQIIRLAHTPSAGKFTSEPSISYSLAVAKLTLDWMPLRPRSGCFMMPTKTLIAAAMKPEAERLAVELADLPLDQIERAVSLYVQKAVQELEQSDIPRGKIVQAALSLLIHERERVLGREGE